MLAGTFLVLILVGTALLAMPFAHAEHARAVHPLDALFTATSAVCVTGLIVVDTGRDFSTAGQVIILVLIQLGGLGIMTFAALAAQVIGGRLSFRSQAALYDSFYQRDAAGKIGRDLKRILLLTFLFEAIGTALLFAEFRRQAGGHPPFFTALFHSISAFCNAGFSLYSDSLINYRARPLITTTIATLIVLGGLGHSVLLESARRIARRLTNRRNESVLLSLHSRTVLLTSFGLILFGAIAIGGLGLTVGERTIGEKIANAMFQSITARTAGFNTVDIASLPAASLLVLMALMFVGGSPGSCAGGIKTTSFAVWLAHLRAKLTSAKDVTLLERRLPEEIVARAAVVGGLALIWNAIGCVLLAATELPHLAHATMIDVMFEQISAFATVGLSTGITPELSIAGKLWIITTMFVGRVGPLTAALAVMSRERADIRYIEERVMIG